MTLAQVQATVALVVALVVGWTGLMVAVALLFPARTRRAEAAIVQSPGRRFGLGLLGIGIATLAGAFLAAPNGMAKLIGLAISTALLAAVTIGAAGLSRLLGQRVAEASGARSEFGALVRGSLLFSVAGLFPGIGWYLFGPTAAVLSMGGGMVALWPEKRRATPPRAPEPA
ncbi:MAG: hypothetical protein FJX72_19180 [Armatimonadetes bacterium]|nr:hypothetical protein [Armatimonadota bacterium]